jgi:hypothetical protein
LSIWLLSLDKYLSPFIFSLSTGIEKEGKEMKGLGSLSLSMMMEELFFSFNVEP